MLCHGAWIESHTSPPPAALCGRPVVFVLDAWTDLSFQPLTLLGVWFFCLVAFGPAQTFGDFRFDVLLKSLSTQVLEPPTSAIII
jgi:hypothetical protein